MNLRTTFPPTLDQQLISLLDVAVSSDWERWLTDTAAVFGTGAATLAPLGAASVGWKGGVSIGLSGERRAAYQAHFHRLDTWVQRISAAPIGKVQSLTRAMPDHSLIRSEFYNDYMRPANRRYSLGVTFESGGLRMMLCILREANQQDFTDEEIASFGRLTGFLSRAVTTHRTLRLMESITAPTQAVMNDSRRGILFLDSCHRVIFANDVAHGLMNEGDFVGTRVGKFMAMDRSDQRKFQTLLDGLQTRPGATAVLQMMGVHSGGRLTASVTSIAPAAAATTTMDLGVARPAFLVMTNATTPAEVGPEHLTAIYGLTPREAKVTSLLAGGSDVDVIASMLTISRETVRFHLKNVFAKTRTHSQRDLVREIVNSLPASAFATTTR